MPTAQGALEYLLLIGGAIVVASVVIVLVLGISSTGGRGAASAAYSLQVKSLMTTNGLAYFKFDGSYADSSGKGLIATPSGSVAFTSGRLGQAAGFDGNPARITVPNFNSPNTITITFWAKSSNYENKIPVSINSDSDAALSIFFNSGRINWNIYDGATNYFNISGTPASYPNSEWHHFAVVAQNPNLAKLYIDGVYAGSAITYRNPTTTNADLVIGDIYGSSGYYFNGPIDELMIFNTALSDAQIAYFAKNS